LNDLRTHPEPKSSKEKGIKKEEASKNSTSQGETQSAQSKHIELYPEVL